MVILLLWIVLSSGFVAGHSCVFSITFDGMWCRRLYVIQVGFEKGLTLLLCIGTFVIMPWKGNF